MREMMPQDENWSVWANRANPHFTIALSRCVDHGVPADMAGFLGLMFFFGVASAGPVDSMSRDDILLFKRNICLALDRLAGVEPEVEVKP
jgi:hypothetical protein